MNILPKKATDRFGLENEAKQALARDHSFANEAQRYSRLFSLDLVSVASHFKNSAFDEEDEWRIVFTPPDNAPKKLWIVGSLAIPYVEFSLKLRALGTLREVIVGPSPHQDLSLDSLKFHLNQELKRDVLVLGSAIEYRGM